ncbi:MAG: hypothetical protein ACXVUE_22340 [Solirubrobacteraceae bacterium]
MRKWTVGLASVASLWAAVACAQLPHAAAAASLPPPRFGHTLNIGLVSGTVIVTPPGKQPFKLGTQDRSIPIGSLLDTTHGRVDLRAAPSPGTAGTARVQDAEFYRGKFRVRQAPGSQVTDVLLAGGNTAACKPQIAAQAARALPHRVLRLLGASGKGRFRTRGRYAAATVRGTVWTTTDYCDGTLVSVQRDVVSVLDLVRHKTVTVTAGHNYFAQAP